MRERGKFERACLSCFMCVRGKIPGFQVHGIWVYECVRYGSQEREIWVYECVRYGFQERGIWVYFCGQGNGHGRGRNGLRELLGCMGEVLGRFWGGFKGCQYAYIQVVAVLKGNLGNF